MIVVNTQEDIGLLEKNMDLFNRLSSSKTNWSKSDAFATGRASVTELVLLGRLMWNMGLKYLGVFLSNDVLIKNGESVLESIQGRLKKWRWLLPSMSFRGRTLIINNLPSSSSWHRLAVVDPPSGLLSQIQALVN